MYFRFILIFLFNLLSLSSADAEAPGRIISFEYCSGTFNLALDSSVEIPFNQPVNQATTQAFYNKLKQGNYGPIISELKKFKEKYSLNDWLYYQLIRKTAQQISPKAENYPRYTLYKWFFLIESGYDARLALSNNKLLFYVRSDDEVFDIPYYQEGRNQYVCLNFHDFPGLDYQKNEIKPMKLDLPEAKVLFSYKITRMPDFLPGDYSEKSLNFKYHHKEYHFKVLLNDQVESIFKNYPVVNFETYFNIPLTQETYSSLIPLLKKNMEGMNQKKGVDYLMRFTRYAFLYEPDEANFGKEKRLSPEQTLFSAYSDCDDRAGLFFYLVKEIYNLPMIALLYPTHITMAVQFNKPLSNSIIYKGKKYSICEPTPQNEDLKIGQVSKKLKSTSYSIVYQYTPLPH